MSFMHILGGILVGIVVGRIFATFTLRKIKWKKFLFMAVGILGSLVCDIIFKTLYEHDLVSNFFYRETTIIIEMIAGASIACYLLNLFGKKEKIKF
jgi:uncharacterized membrane protein YeaQ/YmgE (transglycosylase-associated protein family)